MRKLKHVFLGTLFLLLIATLQPVLAEAPSASVSATAPTTNEYLYKNVDPQVPRNIHTLSQNVFIETLSTISCALSGLDPVNPKTGCLGFNSSNGQLSYVTQKGGATHILGSMIGDTFVIPVSSAGYVAYAMDNFGIAKKTYAQANGVGYDRLSPLLGVWTKFRDIAYLAFVLAFTIIGLAIMFRVKIDARTVMSIQNQIPKIVIALVLVTFSYAIAGFLIDIMYVLIYLVILTFNSVNPTHLNVNGNVFSVFNSAFKPDNPASALSGSGIINLSVSASSGIGSMLSSLATGFLDSEISLFFFNFFTPLGALKIGCEATTTTIKIITFGIGGHGDCSFLDNFFQNVVTAVFTIIAFLIVLIAILFSLFRIWFTLVKSFIYVLLDAMIGPLWITAGIFPGSKLGFTSWVRHIMGHLSVFPMTFAVILLGKTIMDGVSQGNGIGLFSPPLVGGTFGGNGTLASIIGLGFIISIPTILEKTRKTVGAMDFGLVDIKTSLAASQGLAGKGYGGVKEATFGAKAEYTKDGKMKEIEGPTRFLKGMLGR